MAAVAEQPKRTIVRLANPNPQIQIPVLHPRTGAQLGSRAVKAPHLNESVTRCEMRPGFADPDHAELALSTDNDRMLSMIARGLPNELRRYAVGVAELEQLLDKHSARVRPKWVQCDDPYFAEAIAAHFGCPIGEPQNLLTNVGVDALHNQHFSATPPAPFNYMAITADTGTPLVGDTTLPGEITTVGGGLIRALATYAHTAGTNSSTLTKTFAANASDTRPVTIAKLGVFNATTAGIIAYHTFLSQNVTLAVIGDSLTVTETITGGR